MKYFGFFLILIINTNTDFFFFKYTKYMWNWPLSEVSLLKSALNYSDAKNI